MGRLGHFGRHHNKSPKRAELHGILSSQVTAAEILIFPKFLGFFHSLVTAVRRNCDRDRCRISSSSEVSATRDWRTIRNGTVSSRLINHACPLCPICFQVVTIDEIRLSSLTEVLFSNLLFFCARLWLEYISVYIAREGLVALVTSFHRRLAKFETVCPKISHSKCPCLFQSKPATTHYKIMKASTQMNMKISCSRWTSGCLMATSFSRLV